ncbi:hypothetical protein JCM10207_000488 [Rhodosporidiobolus poonsookiae]
MAPANQPPAAPAAPPAAPPPAFSPLTRATSTRSTHWEATGAPGIDANDLPAFSQLDRTASQASVRSLRDVQARAGYSAASGLAPRTSAHGRQPRCDGGAQVGPRRSSRRGAPVAVGGKDGRIVEDTETPVVDEEIAVGDDGEEVVETVDHAQLMYDRFSPRRKNLIVAIVSFAALLAPFASSSFLPSIPQLVEDLNTTATIINVTVAIYILVIGLVPLIWAPYAGVYGRRPIYIVSLPIFALGSMGVALSNSLAALIVTRIIQAIGSCAVLSVGAGTVGDLYPKQERGTAMGWFYLGILFGPATAPAIAGILTEYAHPLGQGWRAMQWLLMAMGVLSSALVIAFFPETAHARGIDVIRQERLAARAEKQGVEVEVLKEQEKARRRDMGWVRRKWDGLVWVWLNPLTPLRLLLHPHILAMSVNSAFTLMSTYTVLVPLSQTVAPRYNITNAALLGCFYLSQGVGNAVCSRFSGKYADWTLRHWLKKRNGQYVPEDRLKATLLGGGIVLPGSVLALGWVLDRVGGKVGLAWTVILLFVDGVGLMIVLTPANTYCVDVMGARASEVIAVNNACRYVLSAAASAFVLPMIQAIGVGWTNTFAALFVWVGFGIVLATIRWGGKMRKLGTKWEGSASEGTDGKDAVREKEKEDKGVAVAGSGESARTEVGVDAEKGKGKEGGAEAE